MNVKFVFLSLVLGILFLDLVFAPAVGSGTTIVSGGTTPGSTGTTVSGGLTSSSGPKTVILSHSPIVAPGSAPSASKVVGVGSGLVVSKLPCENILVCWSKMLKKFSSELNARISSG